MTKGRYTTVLTKLFDVLDVPESERQITLESIKVKLGSDLLRSLAGELTEEERLWLRKQKTEPAADDPYILEIRKRIFDNHTPEDLQARTVPLFKKLLAGYAAFKMSDLSAEKRYPLEKIIKQLENSNLWN